jgi:hypothetical protein
VCGFVCVCVRACVCLHTKFSTFKLPQLKHISTHLQLAGLIGRLEASSSFAGSPGATLDLIRSKSTLGQLPHGKQPGWRGSQQGHDTGDGKQESFAAEEEKSGEARMGEGCKGGGGGQQSRSEGCTDGNHSSNTISGSLPKWKRTVLMVMNNRWALAWKLLIDGYEQQVGTCLETTCRIVGQIQYSTELLSVPPVYRSNMS